MKASIEQIAAAIREWESEQHDPADVLDGIDVLESLIEWLDEKWGEDSEDDEESEEEEAYPWYENEEGE